MGNKAGQTKVRQTRGLGWTTGLREIGVGRIGVDMGEQGQTMAGRGRTRVDIGKRGWTKMDRGAARADGGRQGRIGAKKRGPAEDRGS